jgi:hypothetical protein
MNSVSWFIKTVYSLWKNVLVKLCLAYGLGLFRFSLVVVVSVHKNLMSECLVSLLRAFKYVAVVAEAYGILR